MSKCVWDMTGLESSFNNSLSDGTLRIRCFLVIKLNTVPKSCSFFNSFPYSTCHHHPKKKRGTTPPPPEPVSFFMTLKAKKVFVTNLITLMALELMSVLNQFPSSHHLFKSHEQYLLHRNIHLVVITRQDHQLCRSTLM